MQHDKATEKTWFLLPNQMNNLRRTCATSKIMNVDDVVEIEMIMYGLKGDVAVRR